MVNRLISSLVMLGIAAGAFWLGRAAIVPLLLFIAIGACVELFNMFKGRAALAAAYVAVGFGSLAYIYMAYGVKMTLFLFMITIATDVGALFIGGAIGGKKLAPSVSPNKTWSGAIGGTVLAVALAMIFGAGDCLNIAPDSALFSYALFLSAAGQAGDLFESKLKRLAGVKDSSNLIPGHGGILDRFDSVMFAAPMLVLLLKVSV